MGRWGWGGRHIASLTEREVLASSRAEGVYRSPVLSLPVSVLEEQ